MAPSVGDPQVNWAGNLEYRFRTVHRPTSLDELRSLVLATPRIRVLGSRHSFNALPDCESVVSTRALPGDLVVDREAMTVTCPGSLTYAELAAGLRPFGLGVHNLASLPHISLAGAVATATHGSGDANGNLATAVAAVELLTAAGELVTLQRGTPELEGAVVGLGALGVVTRLTLDVEPAYEVAQVVYEGLAWEALLDGFDEITASGYSVSTFTRWQPSGAGSVWVKRRTGDGPGWPDTVAGAAPADGERHPIPGLDPVSCTAQQGVPGPWDERLPHFRSGFRPSNGSEIQSEYHLPRAHARDAILALLGATTAIAPLLQVGEIRTAAADRLWLSPQHERDTVSFHFTWVRDTAGVDRALRTVEAALEPYDPRPHWGKVFGYGRDTGRRYPRLEDFLALRRHLDPTERFGNEWLSEHLAG